MRDRNFEGASGVLAREIEVNDTRIRIDGVVKQIKGIARMHIICKVDNCLYRSERTCGV